MAYSKFSRFLVKTPIHIRRILKTLQDEDAYSAYPIKSLNLLGKLINENNAQALHGLLKEALDEIEQAKPEVNEKSEFIKLRSYC